MTVIRHVILFMLLCFSAISDIREYRVPNIMIAAWLIIGLIPMYGEGGWVGVSLYCLRVVSVSAAMFIFYRCRILGGADIKLLSLLCGYLGYRSFFICLLYALIAGAVIGLIMLLRRHNFKAGLIHLYQYIKRVLSTKRMLAYRPPGEKANNVIPFAACILLGYIFYTVRLIWGA